MKLTPTHKYDDIINLPHPVSQSRPHMSMSDRAAQFSPFAALTGFEEAVNETARLTEGYSELEDEQIDEINHILNHLAKHLADRPEITLTYFLPDAKKAGGSYNTITGIVKAIDQIHQQLRFENELSVSFYQITKIEPSISSENSILQE